MGLTLDAAFPPVLLEMNLHCGRCTGGEGHCGTDIMVRDRVPSMDGKYVRDEANSRAASTATLEPPRSQISRMRPVCRLQFSSVSRRPLDLQGPGQIDGQLVELEARRRHFETYSVLSILRLGLDTTSS